MRFAACLHGASVARSSLRLHPTDRRAIALARATGAEIVAVEAVGERGSAPVAVGEALAAGAHRALRIVEPALAESDACATGFALAAVLDHLNVDLVIFGNDADPEGLADVPASIALNMSALYVGDVVDLAAAQTDATGEESVVVTIRSGAFIRRVRLPLNAVMGIAPSAEAPVRASEPAAPGQVSVEVKSLADFKIDPSLVRRSHDMRGSIQPAPRPLVTLHSAAAVGALLRRS